LMLMDLDRFKEVNDTIGHQAGDSLLQQVGLRLQGVVRKADTVARLGGDEFGVLLPRLDGEAVALTAERFLKAFETPFVIGEIALNVQASIGIALFPQHGADRDALMRYADIAMYLAKGSGGGYAVYSPERDSYSSVEALARWQHPKGGLIPPDQFITLAERCGFIKPLTVWGLEAALSQSRLWSDEGIDVPISVNLSARTLHDGSFPGRVKDLLDSHGVAPEQLELEITESVIMVDPVRALDILTRLSHMGISLSIDDFGTGYSSLSYLKKLPANAVKIDKSFVINMTYDTNDAQIVRSTIDLAHNLGLKVIAEGVESSEVWDRLLALGCDEAQGYHMSRPLPASELTKWMFNSRWRLANTNRPMHTNLELEL
jgi:diguanylate cyclase